MMSFCKTNMAFILCFLLCGLLVSCSQQSETAPAAPSAAATSTNTAAAPAIKPEFQKLTGKWLRPDGGYILEIKSVDAEGKLEAGYFNPDPITVSKAVALRDSQGTQVVIELRDVNYPGCLYRLKYDPKSDQLYGTYYQAAMDQTFDITFGRMKQDGL
ncbi:MAG TPA: hypothetical protein VNZ22_12805 [Bacillota bacterium]|nr:hypothetical protein [Bacillota bacterium]